MTRDPALPAAPETLTGHAPIAWGAIVRQLSLVRPLSEADLLTVEAAAKAWGRWRSIEEKISEMSGGQPLAGELSKGAGGGLQASPLRVAASRALEDFRALAEALGVDERVDLSSIDLFGYPDRPGRGQKGRPRFRATMRDRNRVRLLLALGWSNPRIAAALEVSLPTLHKYFRAELAARDTMRDRLEARRLELAMEAANAGNISALRELGKLIEREDRMRLSKEAQGDQPEPDEIAKGRAGAMRLGKKEAAVERARQLVESDPDLRPGFGRAH